jgi:hypothetical protein
MQVERPKARFPKLELKREVTADDGIQAEGMEGTSRVCLGRDEEVGAP